MEKPLYYKLFTLQKQQTNKSCAFDKLILTNRK